MNTQNYINIENYIDILKLAIKMQVSQVEELIEIFPNDGWYAGIKQGLDIALEKIDASMFLVKP